MKQAAQLLENDYIIWRLQFIVTYKCEIIWCCDLWMRLRFSCALKSGLLIFFFGWQLFIWMNLFFFPLILKDAQYQLQQQSFTLLLNFQMIRNLVRFIISLFFSMPLFIWIYFKLIYMIWNLLKFSGWARWAKVVESFQLYK